MIMDAVFEKEDDGNGENVDGSWQCSTWCQYHHESWRSFTLLSMMGHEERVMMGASSLRLLRCMRMQGCGVVRSGLVGVLVVV